MDFTIRTPKQLGHALKARRVIKKLTQQEVGRRIGLFQKTISALELTPERSSIESLLKLLSALDLELVLREKPTTAKVARTSATVKTSRISEW